MATRPTALRNLSLLLRLPPARSSSSSSVSPTEISHFNALASTWWDPHGSSRLLHLMNPLRHDFIAACHASQPTPPPRNLRYLDIGCGGGIFAESAARRPGTAHVTGIDPSADVLAVAEGHARQDPALGDEARLRYRNTGIEELELPRTEEEAYDVVALWEVVEHVEYPAAFLERVLPFVRPGGWVVGSTIARTWASWVTTKVVAEEVMGVVPRGTHEWGKYLNEGEMREWFGKGRGFSGWRSEGCVYLPGLGWRMVKGRERWGNYFFGTRRDPVREPNRDP